MGPRSASAANPARLSLADWVARSMQSGCALPAAALLTSMISTDYYGHVQPRRKRAPADIDPRSQAAYTLTEAAHHLRLSSGTLRSWVVGRPYPTTVGPRTFAALIRPASKQPLMLSFWDLVEAHVLRALRQDHQVKVEALHKALRYAEDTLQIDKLLLRKDLLAAPGRLFLDRYGDLIELSASGQVAMRKVFEQHLHRVDWDGRSLPIRLYPFVSVEGASDVRPIAIDPAVAFGRPIVHRAGVSTQAIAERLDAGESVTDVAADYDLTPAEVEQAAVYERAA